MNRESNIQTRPAQTGRRRASRHDQAVLSAEVRRMVRVLRSFGPLPRASLARISQAERWREGSFDHAVKAAIRDGQARELPFDCLAAGRPRGDAGPSGPSGPSGPNVA
jgi:hypothetical protein